MSLPVSAAATPAPSRAPERAVLPAQAKGSPTGNVSREAASALRADPDGPDNIHPQGEPCQTKAECRAFYDRETIFLNPFKYIKYNTSYSQHNAEVRKPDFLVAHMDGKSHAMPDGSLKVILDEGPEGNGSMTTSMMMAKADGINFRFVKNEGIGAAVAKERAAYGKPFTQLRIAAHGSPGVLHGAGGVAFSMEDVISGIAPHMVPGATVNMSSCNVAQTREAREDLQILANKYNLVIKANGNLGDPLNNGYANNHAYVFTPNPKGPTDLSQTRHAKAHEALIRRARDLGAD